MHRLAIGREDISGDEFGDIFSEAIGGAHYRSPLGLGDATVDKTVWSVKTVKDKTPHKKNKVRLISGRNSPDFFHGIENAHADFQKTGGAVLSIWNSRLGRTLSHQPAHPADQTVDRIGRHRLPRRLDRH
ncbi:MAG: hypothetical protein ISN29_08485 [Gammaproteobacteria bacterium AqS3]|nr:hypothetical protein [Gammaproteobacteria bacterium AqS3]